MDAIILLGLLAASAMIAYMRWDERRLAREERELAERIRGYLAMTLAPTHRLVNFTVWHDSITLKRFIRIDASSEQEAIDAVIACSTFERLTQERIDEDGPSIS